MGTEQYNAMITFLEEAAALMTEVPGHVVNNRPKTSLLWLRKARDHLRMASSIIKDCLEDQS